MWSQVGLKKHYYQQASGGDGIPAELCQTLKVDAVKVLHSICQQIWKTQQWPQDWKRSVFIPVPKKGDAKEYSNYCTIALILCVVKVILQDRLSKFFKIGFNSTEPRTSRGTSWVSKRLRNQRSNCEHPLNHSKSKMIPEKHLLLLHWPHENLTVWITTNLKILKEMGIPGHLCCLLQNLYAG